MSNLYAFPSTGVTKWVEVANLRHVLYRIDPDAELPVEFLDLIEDVIKNAPGGDSVYQQGFNLKEPPGTRPVILQEGAFGRTRVYVNLGQLKAIWIDLLLAAGVALSTGGNVPSAVVAGSIRAVSKVKFLSDDEAELVHVLLSYDGLNPYLVPVPMQLVRSSYEEAALDLDGLIDALASKGVLDKSDHGLQLQM